MSTSAHAFYLFSKNRPDSCAENSTDGVQTLQSNPIKFGEMSEIIKTFDSSKHIKRKERLVFTIKLNEMISKWN